MRRVALVYRLDELVGFLEEVAPEARGRLLAIPGAALGSPKACDYRIEAPEGGGRGLRPGRAPGSRSAFDQTSPPNCACCCCCDIVTANFTMAPISATGMKKPVSKLEESTTDT